MNRASLKMLGPDKNTGRVRLSDFRNACDSLTACLYRVGEKLSERDGTGRADYEITCLQLGSTVLEAGPAQNAFDTSNAAIGLFNDTVRALQVDGPIDPMLSNDDLELFKKLAGPLGRTVRQMWIGNVEVTRDYVANIERRLAKPLSAIGTIAGRLEGVNVHDTHEVRIYPAIHRRGISCKFPSELLDTVRVALERTVTVSGKMHYLPDAAFPYLVHIESIFIHPESKSLPTLLDLKGMAPDCTGELSTIEYLQSIRND